MSEPPTEANPLRRRPKLSPEPPPPLEAAPPPKPVFKFRTDFPEPIDKPGKDNQRDVFFITWKATHPHGRLGDEDFERDYGDFQARQFEAKNRHRLEPAPTGPSLTRVVVIVLLVAVAGFILLRVFGSRPPAANPAAGTAPASNR